MEKRAQEITKKIWVDLVAAKAAEKAKDIGAAAVLYGAVNNHIADAKDISSKVSGKIGDELAEAIVNAQNTYIDFQAENGLYTLKTGGPSGEKGAAPGVSTGGGGGGDIQKQVTFDCKEETKRAERLGDIDYSKIIGMNREKNVFRLSFTLPFQYPFMFPEGKGILLYGPPGTGKTFLAQATAVEMNTILENDYIRELGKRPDKHLLHFYSLTGAQLKGAYIGQTEKNIDAAFDCAQLSAENASAQAISLIFFDEFEAIAGSRGGTDISLNTSVPVLLTNLQGSSNRNQVRVIAATNLPEKLDEAILSRFPIKVFVDTPGRQARRDLIYSEVQKFYTRGIPTDIIQINRMALALAAASSKKDDVDSSINAIKVIVDRYIKEYDPCSIATKDDMPRCIRIRDALLKSFEGKINPLNLSSALLEFSRYEIQKISPLIELANAKLGDDKFEGVAIVNHRAVVDYVTDRTGMNDVGKQKLISWIGPERAERFLVEADKFYDSKGLGEFGYANRDIANLVAQAIRFASERSLYQYNPEFKCYPVVPPGCKDDKYAKCTPCELTRQQRYRLRATPLVKDDFDKALNEISSGVDPNQYGKYISYYYRDLVAMRRDTVPATPNI
jgi:SpoVK/Ycf46/Vps4 family AAA+-type ATPase